MSNPPDAVSGMIDKILQKYVDAHKKGDFDADAAITALLRYVETLEKIGNYNLLGRMYNFMGIFEGTRGHFDSSIIYFTRASDAYQRMQNFIRVGRCTANIAETYRLLNKTEFASEYFQLAEEIIAPLDIAIKWEQMVQNRCNEGQLWIANGNYEQAKKLLDEALDIINTQKEADWDLDTIFTFLPETHSSLARIAAYADDFKTAETHLTEAFRILKQKEHLFILGHAHLSQAILALEMKRDLVEITPHFEASLEYLRKANAKFELAEALLFYGDTLQKFERVEQARALWQEAHVIFNDLNLLERRDLVAGRLS